MSDSADDGNGSSSSYSFLHQNCRENWPNWTCIAANVCGLFSTAVWFIVLLPQVWKNFRRKSVHGLSVLWASANFTASLINLFFVFNYATIPLYGQIGSVYSPILEFTLLIQFCVYGRYRKMEKVLYAAGSFLIWGIVIAVELIFALENFVEYVAILLWCVETFPQVILNMKLQSTGGQATSSVVIAMVGKTTDFLSNGGLVIPIHYRIMVYFSSSVAYINGIQVAWYYGHGLENNGGHETDKKSDEKLSEMKSQIVDSRQNIFKYSSKSVTERSQCCNICRWTSIAVLSTLLVGCVAGFCLNIGSYYGLFAPVSIAMVLGAAKLYVYRYRSSSFNVHDETCYDNPIVEA